MFSSTNKDKNDDNTNQKQNLNKDQIILNICYNPENGELTLSDNYNNHYLCDLFGRIKKKIFTKCNRSSIIQRKKNKNR